ncbi:hypothetical protein ZTR_06848 [Talaromyces verruculosus]|nr:hypothetical protein ZTR_06848 [Talaromyces verruculosus]
MSSDWSGISSFYDETRSWPVENAVWPEPCLLLSELQDLQSPDGVKYTENCTDSVFDGRVQYPCIQDHDNHTANCQNSVSTLQDESTLASPNSHDEPETPAPRTTRKDAQKRKEQNRLAQRAFRERKESYIQSLLKQIDEINAQYMRLVESYHTAKNNVLCLQVQMEDLQKKLDVWNNTKLLVLKVGDRSNMNNTQVALCSMSASDVLQEADLQSGSSASSLVLL